MALSWALLLLFSYLLGCTPFAYIAARLLRGVDIRAHGDRNSGAANAWRLLGARAGTAVFIADMGKGAIAVLVTQAVIGGEAAPIAAGLAVIAGHNWPAYLGLQRRPGRGDAAGSAHRAVASGGPVPGGRGGDPAGHRPQRRSSAGLLLRAVPRGGCAHRGLLVPRRLRSAADAGRRSDALGHEPGGRCGGRPGRRGAGAGRVGLLPREVGVSPVDVWSEAGSASLRSVVQLPEEQPDDHR